ncbi:MAG: hypothetical protein LUE98_16805 [Tannerellaceae bacterium]|nr:hypothetical protein [Tannerellaceae bacterium]
MKYCYILFLCTLCCISSLAEEGINLFEVRAGTWIPTGGLKNTFVAAPSFVFYAGWPITKNTALDGGFEMAFPVNSQEFRYYYSGNYYDYTKTHVLLSIGLRLRHQITLAKDIHLTPYTYFSINFLSTNLESGISYDEYGDEKTNYHDVVSFDLSGGVSVRYKLVGCFIEFHHTPYNTGHKVDYGFGCSYVSTGINVCF